MTTKEKKTIILKEVITPAFKEEGYRTIGQTYYRVQGDCCMTVKIQSSHFNSAATGNTFWFHIEAFPKETSREQLKEWNSWGSSSIHESSLLPDCGYLHPYRNALGYCIDGYKNYVPQDMDIEDIKERIGSDLREVILPQLDEIKSLDDWNRQKEEWTEQSWQSTRILLIRYFGSAQMSAVVPEMVLKLRDTQHRFGLSSETIRENEPLYQEVRAFSDWPDDDKWSFILSALE